jgi:hypothetical protein
MQGQGSLALAQANDCAFLIRAGTPAPPRPAPGKSLIKAASPHELVEALS